MMQPRPSGIVPKLFYTRVLSISNMELEINNFKNIDKSGDEPFEMDHTSIVKDLMEKNGIPYTGAENGGGRSVYVIETTPKGEDDCKFSSRTRVWGDSDENKNK